MDIIGRGIIAGFLATLALSAVFDPIAWLARWGDVLPPTFGWLLHFMVGSFLWGAVFAIVHPVMRGPSWLRGILFGLGAWLVVMLALMPLTRAGLFGLSLGFVAPLVMLVVHLSYGALLGSIYGLLDPNGADSHDEHFANPDKEPKPLAR